MNKQKGKSSLMMFATRILDTRGVNKTDYEVFLESVYVCNIPSACAFALTWSFFILLLL